LAGQMEQSHSVGSSSHYDQQYRQPAVSPTED
jgi:hypothetical protein